MNRISTTLLVLTSMGFLASAYAQSTMPSATAPPISKESYEMAKTAAQAQYEVDEKACSVLSGNVQDICAATAHGKHNVAKADAEAAYDTSPKSREAARLARADAKYAVAIQTCDELAGNSKDVCVKEAKSELVKGQADANVARVSADTRNDAADKQAESRTEARDDKANAEFKVALEKCDVLAGQVKDDCVNSAKALFGKS
jgi:hypothetical protein